MDSGRKENKEHCIGNEILVKGIGEVEITGNRTAKGLHSKCRGEKIVFCVQRTFEKIHLCYSNMTGQLNSIVSIDSLGIRKLAINKINSLKVIEKENKNAVISACQPSKYPYEISGKFLSFEAVINMFFQIFMKISSSRKSHGDFEVSITNGLTMLFLQRKG